MTDSIGEHRARINATVDRLIAVGPCEVMREEEIGAGFTPILPGERPWLPRADWPDNIVVSTNGVTVRIVAIYAKQPGHGAFRRLIDGIHAAGLAPVVVEPMLDMPAILQRWGWKFKRVGYGWNAHVIARPRQLRKAKHGQ